MSDTLDRPPGPPAGPWPTEGRGPGDDPGEPKAAPRPWASWIRLALVVAGVVLIGVRFGWPVLAIVGALVVSIFLHETGHFVAAKRTGMKVTEFFIGFGPRLWSFHRGETEYGLKLIPAGAYVRIIGMSNLDEVDPADEDRTYRSKSYPKRLVTVLAGPFANFAVALVLLFTSLVFFGQTQQEGWAVGRVVDGSAAAAMGVQVGDRVVDVNGTRVADWESFGDAVRKSAGTPVAVTVDRGGQELVLHGTTGWRLDQDTARALPPLNMNDEILTVDGRPVSTYDDFRQAMVAASSGTATVVLDRWLDGSSYRYSTDVKVPSDLATDGYRGFVGVSPATTSSTERMGVVQAAGESVTSFGELSAESVRGLGRLFSPAGIARYAELVANAGSDQPADGPAPELHPVDANAPAPSAGSTASAGSSAPSEDRVISILGVVRLGSQAAQADPVTLLGLVAIVNIFLGLFNLVPLPPLDGGHAAVATYEAVRGRLRGRAYRVDMAKLMPVTYVVVFLLMGLGISSLYVDAVSPVPNPFGP